MPDNVFNIRVGKTPRECSVSLNGEPLTGVRRVSFALEANKATMLTLEIMGEVAVDGEFLEETILSVRQPRD